MIKPLDSGNKTKSQSENISTCLISFDSIWENSLQSWTATSCRKNLLEFKFWRSERMSTNQPILTRNCGSSNVLA